MPSLPYLRSLYHRRCLVLHLCRMYDAAVTPLHPPNPHAGRTALMWCVLNDHVSCAESLIQAGAATNIQDRSGKDGDSVGSWVSHTRCVTHTRTQHAHAHVHAHAHAHARVAHFVALAHATSSTRPGAMEILKMLIALEPLTSDTKLIKYYETFTQNSSHSFYIGLDDANTKFRARALRLPSSRPLPEHNVRSGAPLDQQDALGRTSTMHVVKRDQA